MTQPPVLEVLLFKLKPGADEAAFLAANEAVMPDLRAMHGFIRRAFVDHQTGAGQHALLVRLQNGVIHRRGIAEVIAVDDEWNAGAERGRRRRIHL